MYDRRSTFSTEQSTNSSVQKKSRIPSLVKHAQTFTHRSQYRALLARIKTLLRRQQDSEFRDLMPNVVAMLLEPVYKVETTRNLPQGLLLDHLYLA